MHNALLYRIIITLHYNAIHKLIMTLEHNVITQHRNQNNCAMK